MNDPGGLDRLPLLVVHGAAVRAAVTLLFPSLLALWGYRRAHPRARRELADERAAMGPRFDDPAAATEAPVAVLAGEIEGLPAGEVVLAPRLDDYRLSLRCNGVSVALVGPVTMRPASVPAWSDGHPMYALARGDRVLVCGRVQRTTLAAEAPGAYRTAAEGFSVAPAAGESSLVLDYDGAVKATRGKVLAAVASGAALGVALLGALSVFAWALVQSPNGARCQMAPTHGAVVAAASPWRERALVRLALRAGDPACATPEAEQRVHALESLAGRSCVLYDREIRGYDVPFGDPVRAARYFDGCLGGEVPAGQFYYRAGALRLASRRLAVLDDAGQVAFAWGSTGAAALHFGAGDYAAAARALSALVRSLEPPPTPEDEPRPVTQRPGSDRNESVEFRLSALRDVREYLTVRARGADYNGGSEFVARVLGAAAGQGTLDGDASGPAGVYVPGEYRARFSDAWRALVVARGLPGPVPSRGLREALVRTDAAESLWSRPSRVAVTGQYALDRAAYDRLFADAPPSAAWLRVRARFASFAAAGASARGAHDEAIELCAAALRDLGASVRTGPAVPAGASPSGAEPLEGLDGLDALDAASFSGEWAGATLLQAVVHLRAGRPLAGEIARPEGVVWRQRDLAAFNAVARLRAAGVLREFEGALHEEPLPVDARPLQLRLMLSDGMEPDTVAAILHEHSVFDARSGRTILQASDGGIVRAEAGRVYDARESAPLRSPSALLHALVEHEALRALVGGVDRAPRASREELLARPSRLEDAVALALLEALDG